jgi:DNA-binding FadR family transcriptional regulator
MGKRNAEALASAHRAETLPQVELVRLYRQIATLLGDKIDQGVFPIGTLLPAERELAQRFGVSRTTVREALIALEVAGKVSIRVGRGVQILEATPRRPEVHDSADVDDLADADLGPIQLMEARLHVEPWTAELAASARGDENLLRMRRAMKTQAGADSANSPQYRDGDMQFHVEIARASGNAAFAVIVKALWAYRSKPLFGKFEELLVGPDRPAKTVAEHRAIYEAIADRDSAAARRAMRRHLNAVLGEFSRGLDDR